VLSILAIQRVHTATFYAIPKIYCIELGPFYKYFLCVTIGACLDILKKAQSSSRSLGEIIFKDSPQPCFVTSAGGEQSLRVTTKMRASTKLETKTGASTKSSSCNIRVPRASIFRPNLLLLNDLNPSTSRSDQQLRSIPASSLTKRAEDGVVGKENSIVSLSSKCMTLFGCCRWQPSSPPLQLPEIPFGWDCQAKVAWQKMQCS
jgi:hypothetical protein